MSEFHDNYPSYETMAHHSEEEGAVKRKKLWRVFFIMLAITIVELIIGFQAETWHLSSAILKVLFIGFTILKAYYIVYAFMHLGDEYKTLKYTILVPFSIFVIYLIFICLTEGAYSMEIRTMIDKLLTLAKGE
jgi:cytochrome c oxidase subunit 4